MKIDKKTYYTLDLIASNGETSRIKCEIDIVDLLILHKINALYFLHRKIYSCTLLSLFLVLDVYICKSDFSYAYRNIHIS